MLQGRARFIYSRTRIKDRIYDKFVINIPAELARDSQFPFRQGDLLEISVTPENKAMTIKKMTKPARHH